METLQTPSEEQGRRKLACVFLVIACAFFVATYFIGLSDNLPGITCLFLGGILLIWGVIYLVWKPGRGTSGQEVLYWAPRVLCIACALFISLFAADVFDGEGRNVLETSIALVMHLIPAFLVLILLAVSWRRELIGGILLLVLAVVYVLSMRGRPFIPLSVTLALASPLVLTGALFLLNWRYRHVLRENSVGGWTPRWFIPSLVAFGLVATPLLTYTLTPKGESVTFSIDAPAAHEVYVTGSFNNWNPHQFPLVRQPHGQWRITIPLPPGRHEYKFVVDTVWTHDVNNPDKVELQPPLTGYNSVMIVGR